MKELLVHLVEPREAGEVCQVNVDLDHLLQAGSCGFENGLDVPKGLANLSLEGVRRRPRLRIHRALARDVHEAVGEHGVGVGSGWFWCPVSCDGLSVHKVLRDATVCTLPTTPATLIRWFSLLVCRSSLPSGHPPRRSSRHRPRRGRLPPGSASDRRRRQDLRWFQGRKPPGRRRTRELRAHASLVGTSSLEMTSSFARPALESANRLFARTWRRCERRCRTI